MHKVCKKGIHPTKRNFASEVLDEESPNRTKRKEVRPINVSPLRHRRKSFPECASRSPPLFTLVPREIPGQATRCTDLVYSQKLAGQGDRKILWIIDLSFKSSKRDQNLDVLTIHSVLKVRKKQSQFGNG